MTRPKKNRYIFPVSNSLGGKNEAIVKWTLYRTVREKVKKSAHGTDTVTANTIVDIRWHSLIMLHVVAGAFVS